MGLDLETSSNFSQDYKKIKDFYPLKLRGNVKELGWGSNFSQIKRFIVIKEIIQSYNLESYSILDVGCGYGDLFDFISPTRYLGIDIREDAIKLAINKNRPCDFINTTINTIDEKFTFCVASGIFCHNTENWEEYTKYTISEMKKRSSVVITNFLIQGGLEKSEMKYIDKNKLSDILGEHKTISGYLQNDITVIING